MSNLLETLRDLPALTGEKASFLLGTDQYIGEGLDEHGHKKEIETRVGVVPQQVEEMRALLNSKGIALDFYFLKGCGSRADFLDSAYLKIGGKMLFEHELSSMQPPDVVHALKEPTAYETFIPGPFMRIGALHSGAFHDESGVAFLFKRRNFAAIYDGSNIGDDTNIPIRGAMSVFAGEIAAEFTVEHFLANGVQSGKVVISGGGVVGQAALNLLLREIKDRIKEVILIEPVPSKVQTLKEMYKEKVTVVEGGKVTNEHLTNSDALLLTAFIKGKTAPDVVEVGQLQHLNDKSIIVDVSIDEKGGIKVPHFDKKQASLPQIQDAISNEIKKMSKGIVYKADDHLPKHKPKKASIAHGATIQPYITLLLYYAAKLHGSRAVTEFILKGNFDNEPASIRPLLTHLRNGLAFHNPAPIGYNSQIISGQKTKDNLHSFFSSNGIAFDEF